MMNIHGIYGCRSSYVFRQTPPPQVDPDTYAQQYAEKNSLSLDDAKLQLKSKYGDPDVSGMNFGQGMNGSLAGLQNSSFSETDSRDGDFDLGSAFKGIGGIFRNIGGAALNFVTGGNRAQNKEEGTDVNQNPLGLVPEEQDLLDKGVPLEVIQKGDDAIMNFIQENNISGYTPKDATNPFSNANASTFDNDDSKNAENDNKTNPFGLAPEEQYLLDKGVPLEVIQKGDDAIMNFIQENNLNIKLK